MLATFGEVPRGPFLDTPPPTAELDRSLGLLDGTRFAVTAGIFSRELSVPGGVVPTAGITWVTVAPTPRTPGRRVPPPPPPRGLPPGVMPRRPAGGHAAGREPVAALWAAESSIYGR